MHIFSKTISILDTLNPSYVIIKDPQNLTRIFCLRPLIQNFQKLTYES